MESAIIDIHSNSKSLQPRN